MSKMNIITTYRTLMAGGALLSIAAMSLSAGAMAQESAQTGMGDGEIIVTANKREQRISDVGLAITALSGDALKSQHVTTLSDLAATIPGLSYTPSANQTPVYTLRGVGFYESTLAAYPTTSVYLDEVGLPFPALTTHANFDIERVEVLKGPQGTLFGQNSTGGAINFIAAKPTSSFEAGGDLSWGRFNRVEANAYVSGPLSDTVRARLAVTGARSDDWQYSYTRPDKTGAAKYYGARILVDWDATERLSFNLSANAWRDQSDPQAPQYQTLLSQNPATTPQELRDLPFPPHDPRVADWNPDRRDPFADNRMFQGALRANWEVAEDVTLTSITSYADLKVNQGFETDGTIFNNDDFFSVDGRIKSFNQEVRISNSGSAQLRWVVGGNYERSKVNELQANDFSESAFAAVYGFTGGYARSNQKMRNLAAFANLEYDFAERFTVKGGLRYTSAKRTSANCLLGFDDGTLAAAQYGAGAAIMLGYVPIPGYTPTGVVLSPEANGCLSLDNVTSDGTPADYHSGEYHGTLKEDNVAWRVGLDFKPNSNSMIYANIARGYKAGSFPTASAATYEQFLPVKQESLTSYEMGFKLSADDRVWQLEGAAFYYQYSDKQLRSKIIDPLFGVLDSLINVPKARMIGGEMELTLRPVRGLTLGATGSILDSKITRYIGLDTAGNSVDYNGAVIPYTPKYQVRLTGDYNWEMGAVAPFVGFSVSARSKAYSNIGGSKALVVTPDFASSVPVDKSYTLPGYALVDLRGGIAAADGSWRVTLFGKNIFNKYYVTNIYTDYDTIARFAGQPATWGITLSMKTK